MAVTDLGERLTRLHSTQQVALRAATIRDVTRLFPALDLSSFEAVDRSWPAFEAALRALIDRQYGVSAGLSVNYYELFRAAEGVAGASTPRVAAPLVAEQVEVSLRVTGPYTAKHLIATGDGQVAAKTLARLSGSMMRLVSEGGRATLDRSLQADKQALGWARVTSGRPCGFCALLASRGPTYKSKETALRTSSGRKYHDACGCSVEGVYDRDAPWPGRAEEFRRIYDEVASEHSGHDAVKAFRRVIERPPT